MESPDFIEYSHDAQVQQRVTDFLSTLRSENTRALTRQIVEFLIKKRKEQWDTKRDDQGEWFGGWTRSGEIFTEMKNKNPNPFTITRLLRDLTTARIIERRECSRVKGKPGKKPVFYRVPGYYNPLHFSSREELLAIIDDQAKKFEKFGLMYRLAQKIFEEETDGKDIIPLVKTRLVKEENEIKAHIEEILDKGYRELDPCKSLS